MKPRLLRLAAALLLLAASAAVARALDGSLSAEIRLGRALPPAPPVVEVVEPVGPKGPPPWAPAHGFRRNRDYYYYPDARVYYRPSDRTWFFLDGGTPGESPPNCPRASASTSAAASRSRWKPTARSSTTPKS